MSLATDTRLRNANTENPATATVIQQSTVIDDARPPIPRIAVGGEPTIGAVLYGAVPGPMTATSVAASDGGSSPSAVVGEGRGEGIAGGAAEIADVLGPVRAVPVTQLVATSWVGMPGGGRERTRRSSGGRIRHGVPLSSNPSWRARR